MPFRRGVGRGQAGAGARAAAQSFEGGACGGLAKMRFKRGRVSACTRDVKEIVTII